MKPDLKQSILQKIHDKHLRPKPKWNFQVRNGMVWGVATVSIFIGSLASAVMIFMVRHNDWSLLAGLGEHRLKTLLFSLPYFWLLSVGILVVIAFYNLKHTKKGYRYPVLIVIVVTVGSSVLLGGVFHAVGWGQVIDNQMTDKVKVYRDHLDPRRKLWNQAERGLLAGTIINLETGKILTLRSVKGEEWQILYSEARVISPKELEINMPVKVVGKKQAEMIMRAEIIKAMIGPRPGWLMPHRRLPMMPGVCESATCTFLNQ